MCVTQSLSVHPDDSLCPGTANAAAAVQPPLQETAFPGQTLRSRTAGSYGVSGFECLREHHAVSQSGCANLRSRQRGTGVSPPLPSSPTLGMSHLSDGHPLHPQDGHSHCDSVFLIREAEPFSG